MPARSSPSKSNMPTKYAAQGLVCYEVWPWPCTHIELPPQKRIATFSPKDAQQYCKQVKDAEWLNKVIVVAGGGSNIAHLGILHKIFPTPQYHYRPEPPHYSKDDWAIAAVIELFDPIFDSTMFIPHLGSWKIALYLENEQPVWGEEMKKSLNIP